VVADLVQPQELVLDQPVIELKAAPAEQGSGADQRRHGQPATLQVGEQEKPATIAAQPQAWK